MSPYSAIRAKLPIDLVVVNISTLILIIFIPFLPSDVLRLILGLPFAVFFPGYTFICALFPRKGALSASERVVLSFGLSIAVVPLIGLILNYAWEITLYPILTSVGLFILGSSAITFYRRWRLPQGERFEVCLPFNRQRWRQGGLDVALTMLVILSVAGAMGTLGYTIAAPRVGERFTEFYILGPEGKAQNYPRELSLGEEGRVILVIVNQEYKTTEYTVEITLDGERVEELGPIIVDHGEKWEQELTFSPAKVGLSQRLQFLLYKGGSAGFYQTLHLWIDVEEAPRPPS